MSLPVPCSQCGLPVPPRRSGGASAGDARLCSDACRRLRRAVTHRRWCDDNRAHQAEYFAARNAEQKQQQPDYFKHHYARHRESRQQKSRDWYRANAERALENRKVYAAANRDKVRVWGRRSANTRRAVTKQVFVEVVDHLTVFARDLGVCGICQTRVEPDSPWEIDHIVPISKGGAHAYANVQLAHRRCNRSKAAKLPT